MPGEYGARAAKHRRLTELALKAAEDSGLVFDEFWNDPEWQVLLDEKCAWVARRRGLWGDDAQGLAEDLKQRACLQMLKEISKFRGESSFATWFATVVDNLQNRDSQRKKKRPAVEEQFPGGGRDLSDQNPEQAAALTEAEETLLPKDRQIYDLARAGKSSMETAQELYELEEMAQDPSRPAWLALSSEQHETKRKKVCAARARIHKILKAALWGESY